MIFAPILSMPPVDLHQQSEVVTMGCKTKYPWNMTVSFNILWESYVSYNFHKDNWLLVL